MNYLPGKNCDLILKHKNHADLPLVCFRIDADDVGPRVKIHYETYWPDNITDVTKYEPSKVRYLWFTVLISDEIIAPDGGWFELSAAEIRQQLHDILAENTNISLETQAGTIQGLYSTDHAIIDTIYQENQTVEIYLTTRNMIDYPAAPEVVRNIWLLDNVAEPAASCWGDAVWK